MEISTPRRYPSITNWRHYRDNCKILMHQCKDDVRRTAACIILDENEVTLWQMLDQDEVRSKQASTHACMNDSEKFVLAGKASENLIMYRSKITFWYTFRCHYKLDQPVAIRIPVQPQTQMLSSHDEGRHSKVVDGYRDKDAISRVLNVRILIVIEIS